jgi:hypothetical protein
MRSDTPYKGISHANPRLGNFHERISPHRILVVHRQYERHEKKLYIPCLSCRLKRLLLVFVDNSFGRFIIGNYLNLNASRGRRSDRNHYNGFGGLTLLPPQNFLCTNPNASTTGR